jgi:hypothetical protein
MFCAKLALRTIPLKTKMFVSKIDRFEQTIRNFSIIACSGELYFDRKEQTYLKQHFKSIFF